MKKTIYNIMFISVLALLAGSCKKDYLETLPTDQVASGDVFATTNNAWAAINGIHRSLYVQYLSNQDQGGISGNMIYMDVMGEDLVMTARANGWFVGEYQWLSHRNVNSRVPYFNYYIFYRIIANANMIINNVDGAEGPDADKNAIKGQALAYRGWAHFNLVQLFSERFDAGGANSGMGVPIMLTNGTEGVARSTVAEVYAQVNKDLDDAIGLLDGYDRDNASHLNANVAKGIKARVALTQQNWALAAQLAAEARDGYPLMSEADYMAGFNDYNNDEWLWGVHQQADQTTFFYSFFAYLSCNFNSTNIRGNPKAINSDLYDLIPESDVRKRLWDPTGANKDFPIPDHPASVRKPYMNRKFHTSAPDQSIGDVPLMRASEMYLIEAEALARAGQDGPAAAALFTLANRRDPDYVLSVNTGQALIDEIMVQRRVELWGEGFRWYDLKRLNQSLERAGANHDAALARVLSIPAGDKQWQFLIPQDEMNANKLMEQNPL
jgi:hypothetical protein